MDPQPKIEESGSPPLLPSGVVGVDTNLMNMSISDLFSKFHAAEARETQLKRQVEKKSRELCTLHERVKFENWDKRRVEERCEKLLEELRTQNRELGEELKKREEQCEEGKKAEERYEKLLEAVKRKKQEDGDTISELRSKIRGLEDENCKHEEIWKSKFVELDERVSRLGNDIESFKNGGEINGIHVLDNAYSTRCQRIGDITFSAGIGQSPRNPNKDASASGRLASGIIDLVQGDNDDDNVCTSQGASDKKEATSQVVTDNGLASSSKAAAQPRNIPSGAADVKGRLKRKFGSSDSPSQFLSNMLGGFDSDVSSSSSYESSECDMEQFLRSCRGYTIDQRKKA